MLLSNKHARTAPLGDELTCDEAECPLLVLSGCGDLIGQASAASVMRQCLRAGSSEELSVTYAVLKFHMLKASTEIVFGNNVEAPATMAMFWGELATCTTLQEGRALCDVNNRAAAVEALTRFMLYAKQADVFLKKISPAASLPQMKIVDATKDRLLTAPKNHTRDGIFVASDFGFFQPSEISQIMRGEKPTRNVCGS